MAMVRKNLEMKNDSYWDFEVKQLVYLWQRNEALIKALQKADLAFRVDELTANRLRRGDLPRRHDTHQTSDMEICAEKIPGLF